ncbi:MAG: phage tail tape measure protein [Candidatus Nanopelagicales bacterium]
MQTQYIKMGRDANGAIKAMSITPRTLEMNDYATKTAIAAQKQALLNQLLKQGSTNLLNFGKNTQWAGRQLMVGFTIPLAYFGTAAAKTFMDLEKQAIRFKRVYGDMFTTTEESNKALADVQRLAEEFTKYGVAVAKTMEMAANAAAMGKTGADLTAQVAQATRLAVLGGVEQAQALETTISVTNAFGVAAEDLASKINFLNAVENQTVVSIEDLTIAIPKAGPVVKQLGGEVEDLAFFLTAMKEGGINASEGANALKSGLASLINPTEKASKMLAGFGINIKAIVEGNQGNIRQTVIDFSRALDTLDPLNRARAIEQLFGKFQFSRLSTLFQNVTKEGTQAARVLDLAGASIEELAILSERELGVLEDSISTDFKESIENLKLAIAPIGKEFLKAVTPIAKALGGFLEKFNNLGDGTKKFIVIATTLVGVIGPVLLMTFGLLANGVANIIKLFITMRSGFLKAGSNTTLLAQQTQYLNTEQLEAAIVAASLNQAHTRLTQSFAIETTAVKLLRQAYIDATFAALNFARANPGMMMPGFKPGMKGGKPKGFASGTTGLPGPKGAGDIIPILGAPGEAIIPAKVAQDERFKPIINAMVNGKLQGYETGTTGIKVPNELNPTGQIYNAKTASSAKDIQNFLNSLQKNPDGTYNYIDPEGKYSKSNIKASTIAEVLRKRSQADKFTPYEIKTKLGLTKEGYKESTKKKGTTSAPQSIRDIINKSKEKAIPGFEIEKQAIQNRLKQQGLGVRQSQLDRLFQVDASHIKPDFDQFGNKIWNLKNVAADAGYVNNYISNSLKGKLGQHLSQMSPKQLQALGIDPGHFKELYSSGNRGMGTHPVSAGQAKTLQAIARYVISKPKGLNLGKNALYQAHALDAGLNARINQTGFYSSGGPRTLEKLQLALTPGERVKYNDGRNKNVTNQTGKRKTSNIKQIGGSTTDTRIVSGKNIKKVTPFKFRGFSPGPFAFGAAGGIDKNGVISQPGMAVSEIEKQFRAEQNSLRRKVQKVERDRIRALKEETVATQKKTKVVNETIPLTKEQIKQQRAQSRQMRSQAIGRVAGPVAGVAGMASMAGFMTGNSGMGMAAMGVSALASIAPMLANPLGLFIAGLVGITAVIYKFKKDMEKARQKGVDLANAMSMTNTKLVELSKITGKVSATESANRRRENRLSGVDKNKRLFGQNVLESDIGKKMASDMATQRVEGRSEESIAKNFANQLAIAVTQGSITTDQARSIAMALGDKLGDYRIPALISGQLVEVLGPDGQNLEKDPINVLLSVQKSSMSDVQNAFDDAIAGANVSAIEKSMPLWKKIFDFPILAPGSQGFEKIEVDKVNEALTAQAIQSGINAVTTAQGQLDIVNQIYDKKLKTAKTEKEIEKIEIDRKTNLGDINKQNASNLQTILTLSKQVNSQKFDAVIKTSLDNLYKDADKNTKTLVNNALKGLNQIKDVDLQTTLKINMSTGALKPGTAEKIIEYSTKNKDFNTNLKLLIDAQGSNQAYEIVALLSRTKSSPETINTVLKTTTENPKDIEQILSAVTVLSKMDETYAFQFDLTTNGDAKFNAAVKAAKDIQDLPKDLTLGLVTELAGKDPNTWALFLASWKDLTLGGKNQTVDASVKIAFDVAQKDKALLERITSGAYTENTLGKLLGLGGGIAGVFKPPAEEEIQEPGSRDTTFDNILQDLKRTRDATINAQGGAKELIRILGGAKDLKAFAGIDQQLSKLGANSDFIDFVGGLEKAIQNKIIKINKKGIVSFTELGKAAKKAYDEKQLGLFSAKNAQVINESLKQRDAFVKLQAAGVSSADALELVSDANFMVALSTQTSTDEIKKMINQYKNMKAIIKETQAFIDPRKTFDDQMNQNMEYYDFLEKQAKAAAEPEIDRLNKLIDANERLIDVKQRSIDEKYDRPISALNEQISLLNRDLDLIDKAAESINKKYDEQEKALNQIAEINDQIAAQEKRRITIADALTQGDISAAAKAIQEDRAAAATAAQERNLNLLQIAREKELAALQSSNGLIRSQIEQKIYSISEQIYELEQKKILASKEILVLEDANYNIQVKQLQPLKDELNARIENIDAARTAWENQTIAIDAAKYKASEYNGTLLFGEGIVTRIKALWDSLTSKTLDLSIKTNTTGTSGSTAIDQQVATIKAQADADLAQASKDLANLTKIINDINKTGSTSSGGGSNTTKPYVYVAPDISVKKPATVPTFGNIYGAPKPAPVSYRSRAMGGIIPKYYVSGGYSRGTDTIPAMLTPGEFVVKRNAVESFGVNRLNKINDGSYDGSSVYNYNLNVNVKSDANPNDIARTVMTQIKQIDNQRIRTQRGA